MQLPITGLLIAFVLAINSPGVCSQEAALPRSTPEAQGVSSAAILDFIETADREASEMHSFMLVRHGHVVAEAWWKPSAAPQKPHVLWSLSKSFTSTAVGLAVAEGKLSIDDLVLSYFPDDAPEEKSANLKAMRIRDLLTMTTGHQNEVFLRNETNWIKAFLAHPVPHKPGTHFQYNTPATFMLSAIVQKVTGQTVVEYLTPRLFEPLGIEQPQWDANPQGISLGGYGLYLKTEDIAKFGQLYLQQGQWQGKQLIPAEWIEQATSKQVSNGSDPANDWDQGYGFQFWRCRHDAFRGDGKDGQFCVVLPEQDAVVAITANIGNMQGALNLVWEKLLPACHDMPLPEDSVNASKLKAAIDGLENRLKYVIYLPQDYDAQTNVPLLLFLHGSGERGQDLEKVKLHGPPKLIAQGKEFPFMVVSPQCATGGGWNTDQLVALLDHIEEKYKVDPDRIYVTGLSMGGYGTWSLAAKIPDRLAAIAPICGGGDVAAAASLTKLPTWVFHGAKDNVVPVANSQDMVDAIKQLGGEPKLTIYPELEHDSWTVTYENPEFYAWLLAQKRPQKTAE
jgi:CubicO group peptidase (beta-lactamase class C family)/pimeloyl-ACP methyl ester carboxylesterase